MALLAIDDSAVLGVTLTDDTGLLTAGVVLTGKGGSSKEQFPPLVLGACVLLEALRSPPGALTKFVDWDEGVDMGVTGVSIGDNATDLLARSRSEARWPISSG